MPLGVQEAHVQEDDESHTRRLSLPAQEEGRLEAWGPVGY